MSTIANALVRRRFPQDEEGLPKGLIQVGYIRSTGRQYIDTGVPSDINGLMASAVVRVEKIGNIYDTILGSQEAYGTVQEGANILIARRSAYQQWGAAWGTMQSTVGLNMKTTAKQSINVSSVVGSDYLEVDGVRRYISNEGSRGTRNLYVFALNNGGTASYHATARLYSMKIFNASGALMRDFIPVLRQADRTAGLYDAVGNAFYTNMGSGSFTWGGDDS